MATRGRGSGEGELDEGGQKVQTSTDKINKYYRCNVQHIKDNEHCCINMKVVKRVNPEFSSQGKQYFFSNSFMLYLYETMDVHYTYCGHHFMMYVSHIIILYTLNCYSAVCQLCRTETGKTMK